MGDGMRAPGRRHTAAAVRVLVGAGVAGASLEAARRVMVARRRGAGEKTRPEPAVPDLLAAFPEAPEAARALEAAGLTVAVAESCTGGLLGAALTALPGSSAYMRGGVVAYADDVKRDLLGVPAQVLARHGAVSEQTAEAMAEGVRAALDSSVGVAVTGIAGPASDATAKPVGLVVVAVAGPGLGRRVEVLRGDRGRDGNRSRAVRRALAMLAGAASGIESG